MIRNAVFDDIPVLAEFEREISAISFGDEAVTDINHHITRLKKSMEKTAGGMFVLENGVTINGWLWMDIKTNFLTEEKYVNFRSFYLTENIRGTAEGDELLTHGLNWCRENNVRRVVGKVHSRNLPMRALYKKAGFEATHVTMEFDFYD